MDFSYSDTDIDNAFVGIIDLKGKVFSVTLDKGGTPSMFGKYLLENLKNYRDVIQAIPKGNIYFLKNKLRYIQEKRNDGHFKEYSSIIEFYHDCRLSRVQYYYIFDCVTMLWNVGSTCDDIIKEKCIELSYELLNKIDEYNYNTFVKKDGYKETELSEWEPFL